MDIKLRRGVAGDVEPCGRILYLAFKAIADQHNFPPDQPSVEVATALARMLLEHPGFYGVVAEGEDGIIGSNFLDERAPIAGIGPLSVDPTVQNRGIGRRLMQDVLERAASRNAAGVRLAQSAFHNRSLCLYTTLGFRTREPLSTLQGAPPKLRFAGYDVRPAVATDLAACNRLCRQVHGFDRSRELASAVDQKTAHVVEHLGRITGYTTAIAFFGHAVGETNRDLMALIAAAERFEGPGFLVPTRNHELFAWCLEHKLKLVFQMNSMTIGLYNEPAGSYLPSVLY